MQITVHNHFLFTSNFPLTSGDCICFITWQNPTGTCSIEITHPQLPYGFFVPLCAFVPFTSCFLCLSLIPIFISIVSMIKKTEQKQLQRVKFYEENIKGTKIPSRRVLFTFMPLCPLLLWSLLRIHLTYCNTLQHAIKCKAEGAFCLPSVELPLPPLAACFFYPRNLTAANQAVKY